VCDAGWFGRTCTVDLTSGDDVGVVDDVVGGGAPLVRNHSLHRRTRRRERFERRPRVYVYELPAAVGAVCNADAGAGRARAGYGPYQAVDTLYGRLLSDFQVRTLDPEEADVFFLPHVFACTMNVGASDEYILRQVEWIRANFPYWDRRGGADHAYFVGTDRGGVGPVPPELQRAIQVSHFGWSDPRLPPAATFLPTRDVVVPCDCGYEPHAIVGDTFLKRDIFFFFAGGVQLEQLAYSGGVRQRAYAALNGRPGVVFVEGRLEGGFDAYNAMIRRSVFCLAALGHGWDQRLVAAVTGGCVPVIALDHGWPVFFDVLNYTAFSVQVSESEVDSLYEKLRAIPRHTILSMQRELLRVQRMFFWNDSVGGAYEATLTSLARRAAANDTKFS